MHSGRTSVTASTVFRVFVPIIVGLLLSQAVATILVYHSNRQIFASAKAIEAAGYLSIPTGPAMQTLTQFGSAFGGGLFYTLSIGTGLALAAWAAMFLWHQVFGRSPKLLIAYGIAWGFLLIWINSSGPAWLPSIFSLLIPPATAWTAARVLAQDKLSTRRLWLVPVFTLALLTALWATQFNQNLFVAIRDHILLSNTVGHKVNDFYYRYTLYAAEAFKSFNQKTIRTYQWTDTTDAALAQRIESRMARHDVLPLAGTAATDVRLTHRQDNLVMTSAGGRTLQTTPAEFIADPLAWLKQYSELTDRLAPFRRMTLYGLLIGFPVLLFVAVYGGLRTVTGLLWEEKKAVMTASGICMAVGILLFLPMLNIRPKEITSDNIASSLTADAWPERVAALRHIEQNKIDISRYPQYRSLVNSPLVVERYWLARAMASSRTISTYTHLTVLLKDPHPNVVCQAYYALGQRKTPSAIKPIQRQLKTSDHWYTQWYGYRAMRRLGWQQKPSK